MIQGSLVALVTPFRNGEIDEDAIRNMVHWHIEQGTNGCISVTANVAPALWLPVF